MCLKRSGRRHVLFRVTQELPISLSLSLSVSSPHPQEYSACFGPLSSHPFNPSPPLLSPFLGPLISLAYWLITLFFLTVLFLFVKLWLSRSPISLSLSPPLTRVFRGPPHLLHLPAPLLRSVSVISVRWHKRTKKKEGGKRRKKTHLQMRHTHAHTNHKKWISRSACRCALHCHLLWKMWKQLSERLSGAHSTCKHHHKLSGFL